jgi:hypothetical protein
VPLRTGLSLIQAAGAHRTALFASVTEYGSSGVPGFSYTVIARCDRGASWQEANKGLPECGTSPCFTATGIEGDVIVAGTAGCGVYLSGR